MADLIDRQAAIQAMLELQKEDDDTYGCHIPEAFHGERAAEALKALPSVEPTLYGYNIEHLDLIARVLQKEDLPPERVVEALTDIGRIVEIVKDEYEEALRKAVEQCTI